jgi:hypothetical protein
MVTRAARAVSNGDVEPIDAVAGVLLVLGKERCLRP